MANSNGWKIIGERNEDGSLWMLTNPRGNTLRYKYGSSGYLNKIEVDGHKWATYEFDQKEQEVITRYDDYTEKMVYDEGGNIRKYEVQTETASGPKIQGLTFDYNKSGNLTKIAGSGIPSVNISYTEDGIRPARIITPQAEIRYSYNPDGLIGKMIHSGDLSVNYTYDSNDLIAISIQQADAVASAVFEDGLLGQFKDFSGGSWSYVYDAQDNLTTVTDPTGTDGQYSYDESRLTKVRLPGGARIRYLYGQVPGKEGEGKTTAGIFRLMAVSFLPEGQELPAQQTFPWKTTGLIGLAILGLLGTIWWYGRRQVM